MTAIGIFILGHFLSSHILGYRRFRGPVIWQRLIAIVRYLSYRGFHVKALRWNSAPVGVLLLGLAGTVFFFCELRRRSAFALVCLTQTDGSPRYGFGPAALLLARYHVRRLASPCNSIRVDGSCMHAFRFVSRTQPLSYAVLIPFKVQRQARQTGLPL